MPLRGASSPKLRVARKREPQHSAGVPRGDRDQLAALGAAIRQLREARGLTQEEVTDRAGLSKNTVGTAERGDFAPTFPVLASIADGLGVTLGELVRVYEERLGEQ